jgi:hypothetical protein
MDAAISAFFNRQYWTRMWVVQEVLLAKEIQIICGDQLLPWGHLYSWYQTIRSVKVGGSVHICELSLELVHSPSAVLLDQRACYRKSPGPEYSLDQLIEIYHLQKCSNPRDKVFGLLGLVNSTRGGDGSTIVLPDYAKAPKEIYDDVMRAVHESPRLTSSAAKTRFSSILRQALELESSTNETPEERELR